MKKLAATLFLTVLVATVGFGQSPPTLRIVTESPDLPSELFYGNIKVKPLRIRPGTNQVITIADYDFFIQQQYIDFLRRFPEPSGMSFYLNILNGCAPSDTECIKYTRGALSAKSNRSNEIRSCSPQAHVRIAKSNRGPPEFAANQQMRRDEVRAD